MGEDAVNFHTLCRGRKLAANGDGLRRFVGNGVKKLVERSVPADIDAATFDAVFADFSAHYEKHCNDTTGPYEGIVPLLAEIKRRGYKTAVVSNKTDGAVKELAEEHFKGLFDIAMGESEGYRKKPAPDMVDAVLRMLSVAREDAVYIGDSEVDAATAENAGLDGIFVKWGFRDEETVRAAGGKVFAERPEDILELI